MKALVLSLLLACGPAVLHAADDTLPTLAVSEAFVDLHTGPGRGYPVFHVAARGDVVQLLLAHTSWVKLRTSTGVEGWAPRDALQGTLQAAGVAPGRFARWSDLHLRDKLEFGAAWGRFQSQPMLRLGLRLRLSDGIAVEAAAGQVQGVFSGTDFWHVDTCWPSPGATRRLSPFLGVGVGRFNNFPNQTLVGATDTNANLSNATIGVRWYLTERFVLRADYSLYTAFVSDQRSQEFRAVTAGISFFFY
jgi:SH3-like domain-containing protein